jgi:hypothetical protein
MMSKLLLLLITSYVDDIFNLKTLKNKKIKYKLYKIWRQLLAHTWHNGMKNVKTRENRWHMRAPYLHWILSPFAKTWEVLYSEKQKRALRCVLVFTVAVMNARKHVSSGLKAGCVRRNCSPRQNDRSLLPSKELSSSLRPLNQCVPGVKWLQYEADHSPASSAGAKNEWNYTFTSPHAFVAYKRKIHLYFTRKKKEKKDKRCLRPFRTKFTQKSVRTADICATHVLRPRLWGSDVPQWACRVTGSWWNDWL